MSACVLDQPPSRVVDPQTVNVFVARPQEPGLGELEHLGAEIFADEMLYNRHAHLAR